MLARGFDLSPKLPVLFRCRRMNVDGSGVAPVRLSGADGRAYQCAGSPSFAKLKEWGTDT